MPEPVAASVPDMEPFRRRYEMIRKLTQLIRHVEHNAAKRVRRRGRTWLQPKRHWYSFALIPAKNLLFSLNQCGLSVLDESRWHAHIDQVFRHCYNKSIDYDPELGVLIPPHKGPRVSHVLHEPGQDPWTPLEAALEALIKLHGTIVTEPEKPDWPLSHGDAKVDNCTWHPDENTAYWFDFDIRHRTNMPVAWRRGDDLRALIFSARFIRPALDADRLARLVAERYPWPEALDSLRRRLAEGEPAGNFLHMVQAPLTFEDYVRTAQALMQAVDSRPRTPSDDPPAEPLAAASS